MRQLLIFILGMFLSKLSYSQSQIDSLLKRNANKKVAVADIEGIWYYRDTSHSKIIFEKNGNSYMVIKPMLVGVNYYGFVMNNDSVSVNGSAPNWPPYDCALNLINKETLELKFYQYFSTETTNVIVHRKEN